MNEIGTEMMKAMDTMGLSCVAWGSGWWTGAVIPSFLEGKGGFGRLSNLGFRNSSLVFALAAERWTNSLSSNVCWGKLGNSPFRSTCALWIQRRLMTGHLGCFVGDAAGIWSSRRVVGVYQILQ